MNVRRFPPPSSRSTNFVTLVPKPGRKEGHAVRRSPRCWGDRGAEEVGQHGEAETASGCPRRWCWNDRRSGGTEGSLPCSWVEEGWLPSKRERRSRRRSPGGRSLLPSAMSGEEQGAGDSLPATLDRRSHRRPPGGGGALGRPPKMSSTIAWHREWEPLSWLRTERQRVREPDRDFFFFFSSLPSLVSVSPHPSVSFSLASSVLTPRYAAARPDGPPRRGGGSRAQSRGYPRPARAMGVCDEWGGAESRGNGARPVELMIVSDTCTTHRSRVPRRSSGRIKGGATTVQDEREPGLDFNLCFVCGSRPWGAAALLLCLFMLLKSVECSPVPASFFPFYELCYIKLLFYFY